jgi:hypothetical protein
MTDATGFESLVKADWREAKVTGHTWDSYWSFFVGMDDMKRLDWLHGVYQRWTKGNRPVLAKRALAELILTAQRLA